MSENVVDGLSRRSMSQTEKVGKSVGGCGKSWRVEQDDLPGCTVLGSPG
jgi:hypothetical protein